MTKNESEIYQKFIDYMNNPVIEFTESESKMPMITSFITPEEAEFLTGLPLFADDAKTLEEIAEMKQMELSEIAPLVKALCRKGLIYEGIHEDSVRYNLWSAPEMFLRVIYWSGRDEEPTKSMAPHANRYYMDGWYDQLKPFPVPTLRAVPINETVASGTEILPFEDVTRILDNYDYYTVSHCPCKIRHGMDPDYGESPFPTEVCFHFDALGRYIVENDLGREITKEETLEILKKAADAGLVHGMSNREEDRETLWNCDLEYCTYFKPYHQMAFEKSLDKSNYVVEVAAPETCKACALCIKRCPMDAIQLKFSTKATNKFRKAVVVDADLCIGCGVCVHKCKPKSIVLKEKEERTSPPQNTKELVKRNVTSWLAAQQEKAE